MGYRGSSVRVLCAQGGFCGAKDIDSVAPFMMVEPTRNIIYQRGGRRKRGGTAKMYENPYAAGVRSILKVRFQNQLEYIIVGLANGHIYKNATEAITTTALGANRYFSMAYAEEKVFIADGVNTPQVWDGGAAIRVIAEPAADFSTVPVFQILLHKVGQAERVICLNRRGIYMSKTGMVDGDMEKFITDAEFLPITTSDGIGPVGMIEIGDQLVVFGRQKAYRLDDSNIDSSHWQVFESAWNGGTISWRTLVTTPNDVYAMTTDGDIYSIAAVEAYGDYKMASLTRQAWIFDWIKEHIDLSKSADFHGVYDPILGAARFFMTRKGQSTPTTCLLYYTDRSPESAWMIEDNQSAPSGYNALCSAAAFSSAGSVDVLTGGIDGHVWKLDQANRNDAGAGYYGGFKSAVDDFGDPRFGKLYNQCHISTEAIAAHRMQVRFWIDNAIVGVPRYVDLRGAGAVLGAFLLGTDMLGGGSIIEASLKIGKRGKRLQYEIYTAGANEDFFISEYATDVKGRGAEAKSNTIKGE